MQWTKLVVRPDMLLLLAILMPLAIWAQAPQCKITPDHTLCKHKTLGPRCRDIQAHGVNTQERRLILDMHNTYRQRVATGQEKRGRPGPQPSATNMLQMEWDDELAASAQRLAEQCYYGHDCLDCRRTTEFLVGQNLYQFSENILTPGSNWPQALDAWYDEVALFNPGSIDSFKFVKELGHYTQILWAETYRLGCGYAFYKEGKWYRKLYICNYGPAGNVITDQMYERGQPCSACPDDTTCSTTYPGLCAYRGSGGSNHYAPPPPPPPPPPRPSTTQRPITPRFQYTTSTTTTKRPQYTHRHQSVTPYRPSSTAAFPQQSLSKPSSTFPRPSPQSHRNHFNTNNAFQPTTKYPGFSRTYSTPGPLRKTTRFTRSPSLFSTYTSSLSPPKPTFRVSVASNKPRVKVLSTSVSRTSSSNAILFCDFDEQDCPTRYTGAPWTKQDNGENTYYEASVRPGQSSSLYLRGILDAPAEGSVCVSFRFRKASGSDLQSAPLRLTAGTLKQQQLVADIPQDTPSTNWLHAHVTFPVMDAGFILIFQQTAPRGSDMAVAVDDVLVAKGNCNV